MLPERRVGLVVWDREHQRSGQKRNIFVVKAAFQMDRCLVLAVFWNDPTTPLQ